MHKLTIQNLHTGQTEIYLSDTIETKRDWYMGSRNRVILDGNFQLDTVYPIKIETLESQLSLAIEMN